VSAPCRRAEDLRRVRGRAGHRGLRTLEGAARLIVPVSQLLGPQLAEENGAPTRIAGGRALCGQHEVLELGHRIPYGPTELRKLRTSAPVAPALQGLHRNMEQHGDLFFIDEFVHGVVPFGRVTVLRDRPVRPPLERCPDGDSHLA
jgi:hypothetical protein